MKALIIGSQKIGNGEIDRLVDEGAKLGIGWEIKQFSEPIFDTKNLTQLKQEFESYDFIVSRVTTETDEGERANEVRWSLLQLSPRISKRWLNGNSYTQFPVFSKVFRVMKLASAGIPVPESEYGAQAENLEFPLVIKGLSGNNGRSVFLASSFEEYQVIAKQFGDGRFFTQKMLPVMGDYRVLVVGNKVLGVMKRTPRKGDFLANISQGGQGVATLGREARECGDLALRAANVFACDYAGIDLMRNVQGELVVLEVNRAAGFKGFEEVMKINVAEKIVTFLMAGK